MRRELLVVRAGMLATIQDRGRFGHRADGVAQCGALDGLALAVAHALLHNDSAAAAIELTMGGATFQFASDTAFAVTGADADARLDGVAIAPWSRAFARAGATLSFGQPARGVRTYVAVGGGIDVPVVAGSRSTDLAAGFGGLDGRALRSGDCLRVADGEARKAAMLLRVKPPQWHFDCNDVRVLPGSDYELFTRQARDAFWSASRRVTPQSNRMGYRLAGAPLQGAETIAPMLSHAVFPGVIQVPPAGDPIVLLNDAQTTGGYPKIGVVIEADLWKIAQLPIGASIQFRKTTLGESREAHVEVERYVDAIRALRATLHV